MREKISSNKEREGKRGRDQISCLILQENLKADEKVVIWMRRREG